MSRKAGHPSKRRKIGQLDPLLTEVLENFVCPKFKPFNGISVVQHNLVLVIDYGKTADIQSGYGAAHREYRSSNETFPCLQCRYIRPKVTMMLFPSGQAVFVGGSNLPSTLFNALVFRIKLEKFRQQCRPDIPKSDLYFGHPNKANLVFTASIPGGPFDLASFYASRTGVKYNPKKFPGANMVIFNEDEILLGTAVFFEGGLVNFMGCRKASDAQWAVDYLAAELAPFACDPRERDPNERIVETRVRERKKAMAKATKMRANAENAIHADVLLGDEEELFAALMDEDADGILLD